MSKVNKEWGDAHTMTLTPSCSRVAGVGGEVATLANCAAASAGAARDGAMKQDEEEVVKKI